MAGELCSRGCAWCGRCDAEPDDVCDCGRADCRGECAESVEGAQDERLDDAREETATSGTGSLGRSCRRS
jgi:hypothetical protein